jgi:hypothetical protein
MIAVDGTTPLDAAHIHQFKRGGSCHPTNGLALSKTAHWLFDRGFWSLTDDCEVLVAAQRFEEAGEPAQLLKPRAGQPIHLPPNPLFQPDPVCLRWHRERHGVLGLMCRPLQGLNPLSRRTQGVAGLSTCGPSALRTWKRAEACLKMERGCVEDQPQHAAISSTTRILEACCG